MTNQEIMIRLELLRKLGDVRGKFGWYIYKNTKILSDACAEAVKMRNEAVMEYGVKNADGTYSIDPACDRWSEYLAEVEPVMQIEQDVKLLKMKRDEFDKIAEGSDLSATELSIIDEIIVEGNDE